jgi:hypothetical protein
MIRHEIWNKCRQKNDKFSMVLKAMRKIDGLLTVIARSPIIGGVLMAYRHKNVTRDWQVSRGIRDCDGASSNRWRTSNPSIRLIFRKNFHVC